MTKAAMRTAIFDLSWDIFKMDLVLFAHIVEAQRLPRKLSINERFRLFRYST
jgi:hypothetical protein